MKRLRQFRHGEWADRPSDETLAAATPALEAGDVLFLPDLRFAVEAGEASLFTPRDPRQLEERQLRSRDRPARWHDGDRPGRRDARRIHPALQRLGRGARRRALSRLPRASRPRPCQFSAGRDRGPRLVVAQGRHAAARGQLSGDAVGRPPHLARVQQREPRGARARGASATTSSGSRSGSRLVSVCRSPAAVICWRSSA